MRNSFVIIARVLSYTIGEGMNVFCAARCNGGKTGVKAMDQDCVKVNKITKISGGRGMRLQQETQEASENERRPEECQPLEESVELAEYQRITPEEPEPEQGSAVWERLCELVKETSGVLWRGARVFFASRMKRVAFSGLCGGVVLAVAGGVLFTTCTFAYEVKVGDEVIGVVPTVAAYSEVEAQTAAEVEALTGDTFETPQEVQFSPTIIPKGAYTQSEELADNLKSTCSDMVEACAVKVDGKTVFAMPNLEMANTLLQQYKDMYAVPNQQSAEFSKPVELVVEHVPVDVLKTVESGLSMLQSDVDVEREYTTQEGDTPDTVAAALGLSVEELTAQIADLPEIIPAGECIKVTVKEPLVQVKTTELAQYQEPVPYTVLKQEDAEAYVDETEILTPGEEGLQFVQAYVEKLNGQEVGKQVLSEEMLKAPVEQVEKVGTKERPSPIGTGVFAQPYDGVLTSRYGERWNRMHGGIDIGGNTGDPIRAADNGTVVYAAYNDGGYGNLVQIDHGNGYVTYYGHNSELLVQVGDVVAKGDVIAKLGSTGRSTGPHCHFEVRKDGVTVNPLPYLQGVDVNSVVLDDDE